MMPWIVIKNNFKLMLRSKWILFFMIILPLIVMGVLSSVFEDMLGNDNKIEDLIAGYSIESEKDGDSLSETAWKAFQTECSKNGIQFQLYREDEYESVLKQGKAAVFVRFAAEEITIYRTKDTQIEAIVLTGALSSFVQSVRSADMIMELAAEHPETAGSVNDIYNRGQSGITAEKLPADPIPSSMDYYGIIEIVYFAWCGMISLSVVISSERKNKIGRRLWVAPVSGFSLYFGKLIPCFLATLIEMGVATGLSIMLYGVHWGRIFASAGILMLLCLASSAAGVLLFTVFKNIVVSIVSGYLILMVIGFLGGTFNMYMYAYPEHIAKLSVQYYVNRTLVEFSTMGKSTYAVGCVIFLLTITVVSVIFGMIIINKRKEA